MCTIDINTNILLVGEVIGINESEGWKLIPHIRDVKLKSGKMYPEDQWVDGSYTSIYNIATNEVCEGVTLHYKIEMVNLLGGDHQNNKQKMVLERRKICEYPK